MKRLSELTKVLLRQMACGPRFYCGLFVVALLEVCWLRREVAALNTLPEGNS